MGDFTHPLYYKGISALVLIWFLAYLACRSVWQEVWPSDGQTYVIFPESRTLYYVFRPLTYADGLLTGMRFHIGPHE